MARAAKQVRGIYEHFKRSGIWYVRYRIDGKLVRKKIGTQAQAQSYLDKVRYVRTSGDGVVPVSAKSVVMTAKEVAALPDPAGEHTLGQLCDGLLAKIKSDPEHYRDQENPPQRIACIKEAFGYRPANDIRPFEIRDWLSSLKTPKGARISDGTWNRYRTVFSAIYTWGNEQEKVTVNPVRGFKAKKQPEGVIRWLDPEEDAALRKVLMEDVEKTPATQPILRQQRMHRIYELDIALGTGVRRGEQYRITWPAVNFNRKEIIIPKTKFGPARTVHMIPAVEHALLELKKMPLAPREWKKGSGTKVPEECVFAIHENRTWFTSAVKRAKLKDMHWHVLRHTFCTRLLEKTGNLKLVQAAAGHRTIAMTARYAHLNKTSLADGMALIDWTPTPMPAMPPAPVPAPKKTKAKR
jgi:integrase